MKAERQLDWVEVPLDKIKPYKNNPKEHTQEQVDFVANLIQTYGWTQPICVDENYELIFGHCRLLAAKQLGEETAPVVFRKDLTQAQVKALRIADNKSNESEWQLDKLNIELAEIMALDVELQDVGFGFDELDDMRNANAKYSTGEPQDPNELWEGMPEFEQDDVGQVRTIKVHFMTLEDVDKFAKVMGQTITEKTKFIWFPKLEKKPFGQVVDES